jgi:hypothetical protein
MSGTLLRMTYRMPMTCIIIIATCCTVDAVQNANNSSGNFGFLTQMGDRIIQPLITVIEIYKTHSIGDFNFF